MTKIYIKYGLIIAFSLIVYFILMKLLGLHDNPLFSTLNAIFYGGGIWRAMQTYKRKADSFSYIDGFQIGFFSGAVATLVFTSFMAFYTLQINEVFANAVLDSWGLTYTNGVLVILVSMILMGLSTAMVLSLTFMQRLKSSLFPLDKAAVKAKES